MMFHSGRPLSLADYRSPSTCRLQLGSRDGGGKFAAESCGHIYFNTKMDDREKLFNYEESYVTSGSHLLMASFSDVKSRSTSSCVGAKHAASEEESDGLQHFFGTWKWKGLRWMSWVL